MIANTPRMIDVGSEANRQRARQAGRQQAVLSRKALAALNPSGRRRAGIGGSGRCSTASATPTGCWPNSVRP